MSSVVGGDFRTGVVRQPWVAIMSRTASQELTRVQDAPVSAKIARRVVTVSVTERGLSLDPVVLGFPASVVGRPVASSIRFRTELDVARTRAHRPSITTTEPTHTP